MSSTGGNTMRAGTPIAEDLRERYERCCHPDDEAYSAWECTLIERASAAEERERALREERDALKADVSEGEVIAIVGPDTHPGDVTFRLGAWQVAQEIINARTRPSEKEETAMIAKRAELTKFEELMLNNPQFREAYLTHSDSELSAAWELIADLKAQVARLSAPVTGEEMHLFGNVGNMFRMRHRDGINALIASRTTPPAKEPK